ncbi:amidase substrates transport protein [Rhodococcus sp. ABRD24]|uniref:AmiS/UreI family transporter n=1 Tax=Rhodococcus sp. ABRD24 TaxID=2507582 RepID=UPI001038E423|nr:AmiS/UreI family transporter [Rhodococcus sp. ABRD24]QBJ96759.1 amidase substrates transport protein [Rhodococcus sp. ABRD24]
MSSLSLMFVGSVLLLNGLGLLGVVGPKATAPVNVFIGSALVITVLSAVLSSLKAEAGQLDVVLGVTGFLLFAFTYLYVAFNNFGSLPGDGLGWYCGWAALVSAFLAAVNFVRFSDVKFGFIWLSWVVLFSAFFFVLALGQEWLQRPTGWLAVLQAFTTTTIPGAMQLTGTWNELSTTVVVAVQVIVVAVFLALVARARTTHLEPETVGEKRDLELHR